MPTSTHVVSVPPAPVTCLGGALRVHAVPAASDNLIWIAECVATGDCAIIDGPDAAPALAWCADHGLRPTAVWITHTHGDHIGVIAGMRQAYPEIPVVGSAATAAAIPGLTRAVVAGDEVALGALRARVLRTDGHLTGHVSYHFPGDEGALFCGDTLFAGGCGYLFDGPPEAMFASLLQLAALAPGTAVCCAHEYTEDNLRFAWAVEPGNAALAARIAAALALRAEGRTTLPSTIALERATNPFLRPGSPELLARVAAELPEADLATPAAAFAATRRLKDLKRYRAAPWPPAAA